MECVTVVHPSPTNVLSRQFLLRIDPSEKKAGTTLTFPRAAPAPARPDLTMTFDDIPENVAAVVFSHLGDDPRDRVALAQVSKGWRDAEKSDASLPGGSLSALSALSYELYIDGKYEHSIYWLRKAADRGDVDAMFEMAERYLYFDGFGETLDHKKASEWYERASGWARSRDLRTRVVLLIQGGRRRGEK